MSVVKVKEGGFSGGEVCGKGNGIDLEGINKLALLPSVVCNISQ